MKRMITVICSVLAILAALGIASCAANGHAITLDAADDHMVEECPSRASAGDTVTVRTCLVEDGDVHVSVDGDAECGSFTSAGVYEFTMPDHDVTVRVWITSNGLA